MTADPSARGGPTPPPLPPMEASELASEDVAAKAGRLTSPPPLPDARTPRPVRDPPNPPASDDTPHVVLDLRSSPARRVPDLPPPAEPRPGPSMVVAAHARPAPPPAPSEARRSVVVAAAAVLSLLSVLLVVALVAGTQRWLQARGERADRITQLIQAHRAHQALVREGQEAVRVRAEQDRARYIASGVPDLWDAVVAANAAQRKLSAAADKRYANSQYVQTGDAFQLVAAQYACLAKVIEYDRAATRFAEELRTPLPARVAMKDKQLNCGVLAWPD